MENIKDLQERFKELNGEFTKALEELVRFRKENPQLKGQSAKAIENELIELHRIIKKVSREYDDDLMQGVSLFKIKMKS